MGFGLGAEFGLLPYSISRYFGLKDYGSISGVMYSLVALTTGLTPVLMDVIFDIFGDYKFALLSALVGMVVGAIIIACMSRFNALHNGYIELEDGNFKSAT
jgi:MFS family permease